MIMLIQRVTQASVTIDNKVVGVIGPVFLILLGVERQDDEQRAAKLCERVLAYCIFSDEHGNMNLNVHQSGAVCRWSPNSPWRRMPGGFMMTLPPAACR